MRTFEFSVQLPYWSPLEMAIKKPRHEAGVRIATVERDRKIRT
jgi:hypothetical protein